MKFNYIKRAIQTLPVLAMMVGVISCTDKFDEINKDPNAIYKEDLLGDFNFVGGGLMEAQRNIYVIDPAWNTQLQQNLLADVFSGYMAPPTPFAGNVNNTNYGLVPGWNTFPWDDAYNNVMRPIKRVTELTGTEYPDFGAWALILKVEAMHRVSDIYGPIVYSKYGVVTEDRSVTYDSQEEAYANFFIDLDKAITTLTPYAEEEIAGKITILPFKNFDLAYGGSYAKWVKMANTLRLRLAIRISKVNPEKAKIEGEKALANPIGLLSTVDDNFYISTAATTHPLNVINGSWGDIRMGAPMESIMGGYEDPRLANYFVPAKDPAVSGQYKGIRQGINIDAKDRYVGYSALINFPNKILLMTAAEAFFLKAEAALRGWSGTGSAQENYESGVKASFAQHGAPGAEAYLADDTKKPMPYVDPKAITAGENNIPAGSPYLSDITVKWDEAAVMEEKLERIITQKWIAMYPDGQEAWSEFRRTGYPKLFPVVINNSQGTISTTEFIKRIPFASSELAVNPSGVAGAVTKLSGPDTGGTPLWWDVD